MVWSDFQCRYCNRQGPTLEALRVRYGNSLHSVFRYQRLPFHDNAERAARANVAAHRLGRFRGFHDAMFRNPQRFDPDGLNELAAKLQLDLARFEADVDSDEPRDLIRADRDAGQVGKAAGALFSDDQRSQRLAQWQLRLLNDGRAAHQILGGLKDSGLEWKTVEDVAPIHEAITSLTNNADRMNSAAARAAGLNIGSGTVEATCESLVQVRMCRRGARWRPDTARALLPLYPRSRSATAGTRPSRSCSPRFVERSAVPLGQHETRSS